MDASLSANHGSSRRPASGRLGVPLLVLIAAQLILHGITAVLMLRFTYGSSFAERPLVLVLLLLTGCFVLSLVTCWRLLPVAATRASGVILFVAVVLRLTYLPTPPVQEIDIYRYIWDGASTVAGVGPFAYSPEQSRLAEVTDEDPRLAVLATRASRDPGLRQALERIHYGHLTTVYPVVSQAVFAMADICTPRGVSLETRLLIMKSWVVAFDLATVCIGVSLLRLAGRHPAWILPYAWSPLVLKEFANSGHLDAIAVCFSLAALWMLCRLVWDSHRRRGLQQQSGYRSLYWALTSCVFLALAIAAKIYPVVLLPLWATVIWKCKGALWSGAASGLTAVLVVLLFLPMLAGVNSSVPVEHREHSPVARVLPLTSPAASSLPLTFISQVPSGLPPPPSETEVAGEILSATDSDQSSIATGAMQAALLPVASAVEPGRNGLAAFASRWQMNDLIFMVVEENLRVDHGNESQRQNAEVWFSCVPRSARVAVGNAFALVAQRRANPFLLARIITATVFFVYAWIVAFGTARKLMHSRSPEQAVRLVGAAAFLTLAWFWLLSPTQNPWYWTWALPLVGFTRNRFWLLTGGVAMLYYLRFWLGYYYADQALWGTPYAGTRFFDMVIVWVEFAPLLVALAVGRWVFRSSRENAMGAAA